MWDHHNSRRWVKQSYFCWRMALIVHERTLELGHILFLFLKFFFFFIESDKIVRERNRNRWVNMSKWLTTIFHREGVVELKQIDKHVSRLNTMDPILDPLLLLFISKHYHSSERRKKMKINSGNIIMLLSKILQHILECS